MSWYREASNKDRAGRALHPAASTEDLIRDERGARNASDARDRARRVGGRRRLGRERRAGTAVVLGRDPRDGVVAPRHARAAACARDRPRLSRRRWPRARLDQGPPYG